MASSLNVITLSRIEGPLTPALVQGALQRLQQQHPRLQCCLEGSLAQGLRFRAAPPEPLPLRLVTTEDPDAWRSHLHQELNTPLASDRALGRWVLVSQPHTDSHHLDSHHLITTLHHGIADGLSSLHLQGELLSHCASILAEGDRPNIEEPSVEGSASHDPGSDDFGSENPGSDDFGSDNFGSENPGSDILKPRSHKPRSQPLTVEPLPALEHLLPASHRGWRGQVQGLGLLLGLAWKWWRLRPKMLPFEKTAPLGDRRCDLVQRRLSATETEQLVQCCRRQQTTVQGALAAAFLLTVAQALGGDRPRPLTLGCSSYTDLRRRLTPALDPGQLGLFISALASFHHLPPTPSFWDLAREVKQQLTAGLGRGDQFAAALMGGPLIEVMLATPDRTAIAVNITNGGRLNIPATYGSLRLQEISFMPSQSAFGGSLDAAVTTFQGAMVLNFMFSTPASSREQRERLATTAIDLLQAAIAQG